jgi:cyclophilin family peptidyl-prolyl cis-trans isomerase
VVENGQDWQELAMNCAYRNALEGLKRLAFISFPLLGLLLACQKKSSSPPTEAEKPAETKPAADNRDDPLRQSFAQATRSEAPEDWQPVEKTMTGKSVGKLYEAVKQDWDNISLIGKDGKPLEFVATLETDLGPIEITLRPDLAPNHVRNFLALVNAEYYDGLVFERSVSEESPDNPADKLQYIEAGCPLGTGDPRIGSLGYWLKPEFTTQATHEIGTVGASHNREADTAACKFYITLNKAPYLDGNFTIFGKVTKGFNIVENIFRQPVRLDDNNPEGDHRPLKPVVIKKVTIQAD